MKQRFFIIVVVVIVFVVIIIAVVFIYNGENRKRMSSIGHVTKVHEKERTQDHVVATRNRDASPRTFGPTCAS